MKIFPEEERSIYLKWILIGLLVRLAFMPFTLHGDLVGINKYAFLLVHQGSIPPVRMDYPPLAYYTVGFFQFLFKPVMPFFGFALDSGEPLWGTTSHIYRYLFLLKSHYLIFDFGISFLLLRLVEDRKKRLLAFKLWMLNPLVIFTCYLHGQFDILPTFFVILSLYFVWKSKLGISLLCLAIGAAFKNFPLLFFIPALIFLGKNKREKLKLLLWAAVPYLLFTFPYWGDPGFKQAITTGGGYDETLLNLRFAIGDHTVYIFVLGYAMILAFAYFREPGRNSRDAFRALWQTELVICLWFYVTVYFHPQWTVWMMPLLILLVVGNKKLTSLYWFLIVCVFIYTFWWGSLLSSWLFTRVDPGFFRELKPPSAVIARFYPPNKFINIFRSLFSGISIWLIYEILKRLRRTEERR